MPNTMTKRSHTFGGVTWETTTERITAEWIPLTDEKGRTVHGYATLTEIPADMLGRTLTETSWNGRYTISTKAFAVEIHATRNGERFGALPRTTHYATREEALAHVAKALAAQGARYAKKYAK